MDMKKIINEGIERCVKPLTEKFFKLEEEHNALKQSFFKLEGQHHIIDQSFSELEDEHHILKQRIEENEKRSVPKDRVPELEKTIQSLRFRNVDLECKIKDLKENVDYCLIDKLESNIIKLRVQNTKFKARIGYLEAELELMKEKPSEKGKEKCENSEGGVESGKETTPDKVRVDYNKEFAIAIENGTEGCFFELLGKVDPNMRTGAEGYTPLMRACARSRVMFVKILLARGVEVDAQTKSGRTALMEASYACFGHVSAVRLLLEVGASPNLSDEDGKTALMYACAAGNLEIAKELLKWRAEPDMRCDEGKTALMYASKVGYIEIVKLLLANGADIDSKDGHGKTAYEIAKLASHGALAEYLAICQP